MQVFGFAGTSTVYLKLSAQCCGVLWYVCQIGEKVKTGSEEGG